MDGSAGTDQRSYAAQVETKALQRRNAKAYGCGAKEEMGCVEGEGLSLLFRAVMEPVPHQQQIDGADATRLWKDRISGLVALLEADERGLERAA